MWKPNSAEDGKTPKNENYDDSFAQATKFGTYEIQPTNDTDNFYPAISQGLSKKDDKKIKAEQKLWEERKIDADNS